MFDGILVIALRLIFSNVNEIIEGNERGNDVRRFVLTSNVLNVLTWRMPSGIASRQLCARLSPSSTTPSKPSSGISFKFLTIVSDAGDGLVSYPSYL